MIIIMKGIDDMSSYQWIICPHCGRKQFKLQNEDAIFHLETKCVGCKKLLSVSCDRDRLVYVEVIQPRQRYRNNSRHLSHKPTHHK